MKTETAVRETFRIDGLYKITKEDYVSGRLHKIPYPTVFTR